MNRKDLHLSTFENPDANDHKTIADARTMNRRAVDNQLFMVLCATEPSWETSSFAFEMIAILKPFVTLENVAAFKIFS